MNSKQLANEILKTLLNDLGQMVKNKYEGGHDNCFSREEVAALCERGANNLAMFIPALVLPDAPSPLAADHPEAMHFVNRAIKRWSGGSSIVGVQPGESDE